MAGVAVATMAIVCVLSVFNGFSDLAHSRISLFDPQLKVEPAHGKIIVNADSVAAVISDIDGVAMSVPSVSEQALAMYGGRQMPIKLMGVTDDYQSVTGINNTVIDGRFALSDCFYGSAAVISVGTAMRLGTYAGAPDVMSLYVPRRLGKINPANPMAAFRSDSVGVAGVFEVNQSDHDAETVIVSLDVARRLLDMDHEASSVDVALESGADENKVRQAIVEATGCGFTVKNRLEQEEESLRMISIEKWITFVMLAFILLIASFNVISTLSMLIIEKKDNMATLRALGARSSMIRGIFMREGWIISAIGGVTGLLLGVGLCVLQQTFGLIRLGGDAAKLSVTAYPVRVEAYDILSVVFLVVCVGWIISWITSRFAVR